MNKSRLEEMRKQAMAFHKKHPEIWRLFVKFTFEKISHGFTHYGAKSVMERVRWETDRPKINRGTQFKINNNYTAFYARRFMLMHPEHEDFFRTRRQISEDEPATQLPELTPDYYEE